MTIEIHNAELESLLQQRLEAGHFASVEDMLLKTFRNTPPLGNAEESKAKAHEAAARIRELRKSADWNFRRRVSSRLRPHRAPLLMDAFVVDVSACIPWCCEDEATALSEHLLQRAADRDPLHVPSLWPWEMMNAVTVAIRRQRITPEKAASFLALLSNFDFRIAEAPGLSDMPRLSGLAARHQLTAYDAAYLDLAQRLAVPIANATPA